MALAKETTTTGSTGQNSEITCRPRMTITIEKGKNWFVRGVSSSPNRTVEVLDSQHLKNVPTNPPLFQVSVTDEGSTKKRNVFQSASQVVQSKNVVGSQHDSGNSVDCCVIENERGDEDNEIREVRVVETIELDSDFEISSNQGFISPADGSKKRASVSTKTKPAEMSMPRVYAAGRSGWPAATEEASGSKVGSIDGVLESCIDQTNAPLAMAYSVSLPAAPTTTSVACSMFTCFAPPSIPQTFQPNAQCVQLNPVPSAAGLVPTTAPNGHFPWMIPMHGYMRPPPYSVPPSVQRAPEFALTALQPLQTALPTVQPFVPYPGYPPTSSGWCQQQWARANPQTTQGLVSSNEPSAFAVSPTTQPQSAVVQVDRHLVVVQTQPVPPGTESGAGSPFTFPDPSPERDASVATSNAVQHAGWLTDSLRLLAEGGCSAFARSAERRRNSGRSSRGERPDSGFHSDGDCSSSLFDVNEEQRDSSGAIKGRTNAGSAGLVPDSPEIMVADQVSMNRRVRDKSSKNSKPNTRLVRAKLPIKRPRSRSRKSRSGSKSSSKGRKLNSENSREEFKSAPRRVSKSKREPKSAKQKSNSRSKRARSPIQKQKSPHRSKDKKTAGKQKICSEKPFVGYIQEKVVLERTLAGVKKRVQEQQRAPVLDHFRGISGQGTRIPQSVEEFIRKAQEYEKVEKKQLELKNRLAALQAEKAGIIAKYPNLVIRRLIDDLGFQNESFRKMKAILNELTTTFFTLGDVSQYEPAVLERVKQKLLLKISEKQAEVENAKAECDARKKDIFDVLFRILQMPQRSERSEENLRTWVEMVCVAFNHELQEKNAYETKCLKSLKYSREIDNLRAKLKDFK